MAAESTPESGRSSGTPQTLRALTGLRFLAAAHVVWYHFGDEATPAIWPIKRLQAGAPTALSLFFMLSGFVLTYRYRDLNRTWHAYRSFWWARLVRLYPLHLFTLLLALAIIPAFRKFGPAPDCSWSVIVANGFLVQRWLAPRHAFPSINGPSWTLSIELFFYLAFPWLIRLVTHRNRRTWMVLALSCLVAAGLIDWQHELDVPRGELTLWLLNFPPAYLPQIVLGMALGRRFLDSDAPAPAAMSYLVATALVANLLRQEPSEVLTLGCQSLLLYSLAGGRGALAMVLASRPLVRLGDYSYCIYMLQFPACAAWSIATPHLPAALSPSLHFGIYFVLLVAISAMAFHFVENPLRLKLRRARVLLAKLTVAAGSEQ